MGKRRVPCPGESSTVLCNGEGNTVVCSGERSKVLCSIASPKMLCLGHSGKDLGDSIGVCYEAVTWCCDQLIEVGCSL